MLSKVIVSFKTVSRARDRAILVLGKPNSWLSRSTAESQTVMEVVYNKTRLIHRPIQFASTLGLLLWKY